MNWNKNNIQDSHIAEYIIYDMERHEATKYVGDWQPKGKFQVQNVSRMVWEALRQSCDELLFILCPFSPSVNLVFPLWQVLHEYETQGFEFLKQAFNTPDYLEDITGLTELQRETENAEVR
jgi:hypothetical protein